MSLFPARAFRRQRERTPGLLFAFGVDDLTLDVPTGQTLTFDRNSGRTVFDSAGRVATLAYDQVPWSAHYDSTSGVWEPTYSPEPARTNLCLRSEDFGTTWSAIGTPTRTATAKYCGDVALDLIGDDASGTLEGYSQVVTFTGNAVKAVSVFMAAGTSTSTVVRLRDTSAGADRLLATISWSGGVPSVAMTTGVDVGTVACYNGTYRFLLQASSVTAANTNQIEIYPATTSGLSTSNTGTVYAGGVQAEDYERPRGYLKTLGSTVAAVADNLTVALDLPLDDFTVYGRVARPAYLGLASFTPPHVCAYAPSVNGRFEIYYQQTGPYVTVLLYDGAGSSNNKSAQVQAGGVIEFVVQFQTLRTDPRLRLDVGGGFTAWSTSTLAGMTGWGSTSFNIGQYSTALGGQPSAGIRRIAVASGLRTLAEMRGAQP